MARHWPQDWEILGSNPSRTTGFSGQETNNTRVSLHRGVKRAPVTVWVNESLLRYAPSVPTTVWNLDVVANHWKSGRTWADKSSGFPGVSGFEMFSMLKKVRYFLCTCTCITFIGTCLLHACGNQVYTYYINHTEKII